MPAYPVYIVEDGGHAGGFVLRARCYRRTPCVRHRGGVPTGKNVKSEFEDSK